MNRNSGHILLLLLSLLVFGGIGCKKTYDPFTVDPETIFPTTDGKTRIYYVVDTSFVSTTGPYSVSNYYRMEQLNGTEIDLMGREVQKMYIYTSPDSTDTLGNPVRLYSFQELWTQYLGEQYAERIEGNTRILAMKIPVIDGLSWNANLYNSMPLQTFSYLSMDTTFNCLGTDYPNSVFVLETPERKSGTPGGIIYIEEYAWEVYAPGIGKIARYFKYYHEEGGQAQSDSRILMEILTEHN